MNIYYITQYITVIGWDALLPELEIGPILLMLFFLVLIAKVAGLLCEWATMAMKGRLIIPSVIGEILAGMAIANITGLFDFLKIAENSDIFITLAQLGVILLLFAVGLETPYSELRKVGRTAFFVALLGVLVPFMAGLTLFLALNYSTTEAMFVGAALVATSVGITARVIKDMKLTNAKESRIIIGAAVIDDVLGLIVLSIVVGISNGGSGGLVQTLIVSIEAVIFVLAIMFISSLIPRFRAKRQNEPKNDVCRPETPESRTLSESALSIALILCLGLSFASSYLNLAAIVGAFLAGMLFAEYRDKWFCKDKVDAINEFLVPFFFLYVGMQVDLGAFGPVFALALVLTGVAIATKFVGCGVGAYKMGKDSAMIIGSGMFPRGEVAMIVAALGLQEGVVSNSVFAMVVFMALVTTLVSPPVMSHFFSKKYGKTNKFAKAEEE
ncbi:MAG: putative cation:proton antiport protein [Methanomassiliicoccales archaeon PtaU1.Bin124]|nr:MAG: putative cation:proton antiport protein [Methanomassiliicoccales archaeon PtaU1.Bin124]